MSPRGSGHAVPPRREQAPGATTAAADFPPFPLLAALVPKNEWENLTVLLLLWRQSGEPWVLPAPQHEAAPGALCEKPALVTPAAAARRHRHDCH